MCWGRGPATAWAPWGCRETPRLPLRDGSAAGAASRDPGTSASRTASPGSAAAAPWAGAGGRLRGPDPTPPGRLRSARGPGCHAGAARPSSVQVPADCAGLPGSSSVHLEGGRLPDIAGGDAQQQEAGEAGGGQQQRRQQRQRLPGHGCAGGPGVHGAAAGSLEAERGRGTSGLAPGAGTGPRRPRPLRDGPPTSSLPRAQVRVSVVESPAPPLSASRPQPRRPARCPLSPSCLLCPRVIPPDRTPTPTSKSLPATLGRWALPQDPENTLPSEALAWGPPGRTCLEGPAPGEPALPWPDPEGRRHYPSCRNHVGSRLGPCRGGPTCPRFPPSPGLMAGHRASQAPGYCADPGWACLPWRC